MCCLVWVAYLCGICFARLICGRFVGLFCRLLSLSFFSVGLFAIDRFFCLFRSFAVGQFLSLPLVLHLYVQSLSSPSSPQTSHITVRKFQQVEKNWNYTVVMVMLSVHILIKKNRVKKFVVTIALRIPFICRPERISASGEGTRDYRKACHGRATRVAF